MPAFIPGAETREFIDALDMDLMLALKEAATEALKLDHEAAQRQGVSGMVRLNASRDVEAARALVMAINRITRAIETR